MEEAGLNPRLLWVTRVELEVRLRVNRMNRWGQDAQRGGDIASALACYNAAERGRADLRTLHLERTRILRG